VRLWLKTVLATGGAFALFTLVSLVALPPLTSIYTVRAIEATNKELAAALSDDTDEQLRAKLGKVEAFRATGPTILPDAWVVSEDGKVIASASEHQPPPQWNRAPLPVRRFDVAISSQGSKVRDDLVVTRLQESPARFLVLARIPGSVAFNNSLFTGLAQNAFFFVVWIVLGMWAMVGGVTYFYFRTKAAADAVAQKDKANETKRNRILQELNHDLRTPLTSLRLLVDGMLVFSARYSKKMRENALNEISAELDYVTRLVQFLFTLSDMEEASYRVDFRRIPLQVLLKEEITRRQNSGAQAANGVTWGLVQPRGLIEIDGDRELLLRALRNALDNAAKFASEKVSVTLSVEGGRAVIAIEDDGAGPSTRALERFGKRPDKVKGLEVHSPEKSFGLGSAIMVAITELHGGTTTLTRSERNGGARQLINLPLAIQNSGVKQSA